MNADLKTAQAHSAPVTQFADIAAITWQIRRDVMVANLERLMRMAIALSNPLLQANSQSETARQH